DRPGRHCGIGLEFPLRPQRVYLHLHTPKLIEGKSGRVKSLWLHRVIEQPHNSLRSAAAALGIRPRDQAPRGNGIVIESVHRSAVISTSSSDGLYYRNDLILSQLVEDAEDEFTLDCESSHRPALNDRLARLGVDDSRQDCRSMAHSADDASA